MTVFSDSKYLIIMYLLHSVLVPKSRKIANILMSAGNSIKDLDVFNTTLFNLSNI